MLLEGFENDNVLNFLKKNRDSKILGGDACSPLGKISLQLLFFVKNQKKNFQNLKGILKNVSRPIFDKVF